MTNVLRFPAKDAREEYDLFAMLDLIKGQLEDDDYRDVLCGFLDPTIYIELDEDLKRVVGALLGRVKPAWIHQQHKE